ncbi:hypothetical protein HGRIS_009892 [Hohenbuehelia grisea]|uniref:DUF1742-domain-containing protein n=1 Tax=Hohenbuehelia grisea TaxID=104357 RepID=A0ABR3J2M6_9AGAR
MSFTNLYYKRTTGTPKACYVCYKPTTTVLATINTTDFIYACPGHLTDPGFASPVGETGDNVGGGRKLGLSAEEIAKVKEEWEEQQKEKKQRAEEKKRAEAEKKMDDEKKEQEGKKDNNKNVSKSSKTGSGSSSPATTPTPATPKHERYTLHRDFFAMRLAEHRKRRQAAQTKELAPRLPVVPSGSIPDPWPVP